jgi:hypothetical protein
MSDLMLGGGEMNELMSTKMCSPLLIYLAVIVTSGLSVYLTREHLKRHNTQKMENLFNLYSLNELRFMIVFGLIIFGLCQYNKTTLAWVFLIFPVIYLLIQNVIVHIHVSSAVQTSPKENPMGERRYGVSGGAVMVPEDTHQQRQEQQGIYVPPPKRTDLPVNTSVSQPMGGAMPSSMGGMDGSMGMGMDVNPTGIGAGAGGSDTYASTYF